MNFNYLPRYLLPRMLERKCLNFTCLLCAIFWISQPNYLVDDIFFTLWIDENCCVTDPVHDAIFFGHDEWSSCTHSVKYHVRADIPQGNQDNRVRTPYFLDEAVIHRFAQIKLNRGQIEPFKLILSLYEGFLKEVDILPL